MKILTCSTVLLLAPLAPALAVQIAADPFAAGGSPASGEYASGTNNLFGQSPSITGFSGAWQAGYGGAESPDAVALGLSYPDLASSGGSVRYTGGGNGRGGRLLAAPYGGTSTGQVYLSILIQLESTGDVYRAFELHDGGFDDFNHRTLQIATGEGVGGSVPGSDFSVRVNESVGASLGLQDAAVNLFIIRIDLSDSPGQDTVTVYRNPADLTIESNNAPTAVLENLDVEFDRASFARFNGSSGITFDELRIGTAFNDVTGIVNPDADGDGMDDGWEFTNMVDDPAGDPDMDDLSNLEEFQAMTNPRAADSDGDGIDDKPELDGSGNLFDGEPTSPKEADSDGDGLDDGAEVSAGNGSITNPNQADTDGDGEDDPTEIAAGTDPRDPLSNSAALGDFIIDGTRDNLYGSPLAVQTIETGFGDNQSELNAAWAEVLDGKLYLLLTGNLQANFNKLEILIDSRPGGNTTFASAGNDNTDNMAGLRFDAGFAPDYHLIARRGSGKFDLDFADLTAGQFASYIDVFPTGDEGAATTGVPTETTFAADPPPIRLAYDDSNTGGVGGEAGLAANQAAAAAAATGLELCIDLASLGNPAGELRICAFVNNPDHNFLSNQFLGGLPPGTGNLANPTTIDLSMLDGDQFFTVELPEEAIRIVGFTYDDTSGSGSITFTSIPDRLYRIESSPDLQGEWDELTDEVEGEAGPTSTYDFVEPQPLPGRRYYRVLAAQ